MEERVARLEAQIFDVNSRLTAREAEIVSLTTSNAQLAASHAQAHTELQQLRNSPPGAGPARRYTLIDNKTMVPEKFGMPSGPSWKVWSRDTRKWFRQLDPKFETTFLKVESLADPVPQRIIDSCNITDPQNEEIKLY